MTATFLRPDADSSDGSWLNESLTNVDLYTSVDESTFSDTDFIRSSTTNADTVRLRLSDPLTGVASPLIVRYRAKSEGFPAQMAGYLTQSTSTSSSTGGAGLIAYWELDPTSSFATYTTTLSTAQFDKITDFNDLYVSFANYSTAPHLTGNIDLNFQTGDYYELGATTTKTSTDYLSCTRASVGYANTAAGTLTSFANDTLRITDLGLLVEDARTNILLYSQAMATGGWGIAGVATPTNNATVAPDGTTTAVQLTEDATNNVHSLDQNISAASSGSIYTSSVYAKVGTRRYVEIMLWDESNSYTVNLDLQTGTVTAADITSGTPTNTGYAVETLADGWYRLSVQMTFASIHIRSYIAMSHSATPSYGGFRDSYQGDGSSYLYLWGAQCELGSFPSSYIPTTTTSATRAADAITCIGSLDTVVTGSAVSMVFDLKEYAVSFGTYWHIIDSNSSGRNTVVNTGGATYDAFFTWWGGGALSGTLGNSQLFTTGAKVGFSIDGTGESIVGGGGTVATDAHNTLFTSPITLGPGSQNRLFGYYRRLTAWNSRLADATLQALTAP